MKLTKKLTTLAIVGAISATTAVASAANIGLVQMSQVVNSYPGYGALDMKNATSRCNNTVHKLKRKCKKLTKLRSSSSRSRI